MHQSRRNGLGDAGCFVSREFHDFHREVARRLLDKGQLRMSWSDLDGTPFSAEYDFASSDTVYSYQSGMDAHRLNEAPGRLAWVLALRQAIEDGFAHFDFMRGDEPYKAHFRAEPRPTFDYHAFPNRRLAKLRGHVMLAAGSLKGWVKERMASAKD